MYDMMNYTTGWNYGFIALWGIHIVSVIAFFTGVLFLVVLAIRTFTPAQLKSWAIWLMVIGTVVCLFTIGVLGRPWMGMNAWNSGMNGMQMQQMGQMMQMMMDHDEASPDKDHAVIEEMMRGILDGTGNRGGMMR